ncbi:hypothetical protein ACFY3M_23655 [Streptomyces mirabilis]|uniref:hypothetical protein n=1 Tax=Streptomyces mirabilis TaxID=68239 RepID=UPI003682823D
MSSPYQRRQSTRAPRENARPIARAVAVANVGVVDPALGPHTARVTGYRTVVNRVGANYGVVLHLGTLGGAFTTALAFGTPSTDPDTVRAVAKALRDRVPCPAAARRGLPAGASR